MSSLFEGIFGGGGGSTTTVVNQTPAPSAEELELIKLNKQLAEKQLENINTMQPYQQKLLDMTMQQLEQNQAYTNALNTAISPADQAEAAAAEFKRAQTLGPMQQELMQMQLDDLRRGGAATPEQIARIKTAADAGISAGTEDINTQTQRGIGMIADELANSRGLRLSDSPMTGEAALLSRAGNDQVASLTKNMRAAEAQSVLNYPLAVQQLQSGMNTGTQNLMLASQQFQDQLRQQAYQNRMSLMGSAGSGGIGLASIGAGSGALDALTRSRLANSTQTSTTSNTLSGLDMMKGIGSLATGIGALSGFFVGSDRRLKEDFGKVGKTRSGIDLHLFRYKGESPDAPPRLGVMADEVKKVNPDAVHRHKSGYDVVDYAGIGL